MIKITTTEQLAGVRLVGDYEDLYQLVDAALYESKEAGKNLVTVKLG